MNKDGTETDNVVYYSKKLHFPIHGQGYDMKYFPLFCFYYYKKLLGYNLYFRTFLCDYRLSVEMFRRSTVYDMEANRQLDKAGQLIKIQCSNERTRQDLLKLYKDTYFFVTDDLKYDLNLTNEISETNPFEISSCNRNNFFYQIYSAWVTSIVDQVPVFLNTRTLKIVDMEHVFIERSNHNLEIDINLTPERLIYLADLLSSKINNQPLVTSLKEYVNEEVVTADLIEALTHEASTKSMIRLENLIGLNILLSILTETKY